MSNQSTPLETMSTDERMLTAYDSATSPELLSELSQDEDWFVCLAVTENPNTPADALVVLSQHELDMVRLFVANHSNTPAATLTALSHDDDEAVRFSVAINENTPLHIVEALAPTLANSIDTPIIQDIIQKRKNEAA